MDDRATNERAAFAALVRAARAEKRLKQKEVAHAAGISPSRLSRIEAGQDDPRFSEQVLIVKALGISVDRILALWSAVLKT